MKKKILFVINTLGMAGAEKALMSLLGCIDYQQYEVSLYVIMNQGTLWKELPAEVHVINQNYSTETVFSAEGRKKMCETVLKLGWNHASLIRNLPYMIDNFVDMIKRRQIQIDKLLWKTLADGAPKPKAEYDLAVAFLEGASTYYVANHVKAKKKAAFIHVDYQMAGYTPKLDRGCYEKIDRIFPISNEVRESFLKMYPEYQKKTEVFHNVIDTKRIQRLAMKSGGFTDTFDGIRLLTVGRLDKQKAYEIAIDAMKLLKEEGCKVRWYVLGEGKERGNLEKKITQLGLEKDFRLLGAQENPFPFYKQTDIYVHTTRYEGKSIAIQEAQVLGCLVLASDCSGNREQIRDGMDGKLCKLTANDIKEAIKELLEHQETWNVMKQEASKRQFVYTKDLERLLTMTL